MRERLIDTLTKIAVTDTDKCVKWVGYIQPNGYGQVTVNTKVKLAHRVAFATFHGKEPEVVMHACDNPSCVNVRHLKAGTHTSNVADKVSKSRQTKGSQITQAKLTEEQVLQIRGLRDTMTQACIGAKFGVTRSIINRIINRKLWRHI